MTPREHLVQGHGGWRLDVLELPCAAPRACVVAGHAMMVDRRTLFRGERPSLALELSKRGLAVLVPDLRGHGRSGPQAAAGGVWSYDDIVEDTGAYLELAARLYPGVPCVLLGHSLFGHTALAYLGQHPEAKVAGLVLYAANVWNKRYHAGTPWRWWRKRLAMSGANLLTALFGYTPVRRLGAGSADEARLYWQTLADCVAHDRWLSKSGVDWAAGVGRLTCPVLHVVSEGDRLYALPEDALRFSAAVPRRTVLRVGHAESPPALQGLQLDHMGVATAPAAQPLWAAVAEWIASHAALTTTDPDP